MSSDFLIVNIIAIVLIAFVYWWFFGANPEALWADDQKIIVHVKDGTYQPSHIRIHAGHATKLAFIREDPTLCAETVFFPELQVSYALPLNQTIEITLPPLAQGEINFMCEMAMFKGKIIVV